MLHLRVSTALLGQRRGEPRLGEPLYDSGSEPGLDIANMKQGVAGGSRASWGATQAAYRGDRRLVEERCAQALDAEHRLGHPSGDHLDAWVSTARGFLELTVGSAAAAAAHWQRAAGAAAAAGDRAQAAHWTAAAASMRVGVDDDDDDSLIEAATRGLTLTRESAGPLSIDGALVTLASALARVDPARAAALLAEAIDTNSALGHETAIGFTQKAIVAARLGDWPLTPRLARRAIALGHWEGTQMFLFGMFNVSALALADARPDVAARLQGAARSVGRTLAGTPDLADTTPAATGAADTGSAPNCAGKPPVGSPPPSLGTSSPDYVPRARKWTSTTPWPTPSPRSTPCWPISQLASPEGGALAAGLILHET